MAQDPLDKFFARFTEAELAAARDSAFAKSSAWNRRAKALTELMRLRKSLGIDGEGTEDDPVPDVDLERLAASRNGDEPGEKPTLIEGLERIMRTEDRPWQVEELLSALEARGWTPGGQTPRNSVDATLSRMRRNGRVDRLAPGLYRLPSGTPDEEVASIGAANTRLAEGA
jgi:hypothetical protein